MSARTKALLTLILATPILTEVASGNTPVHALLNPRISLFLLLAYSWPLLVIRESSVRLRLPELSIFLFGLAYGIWNEGLLAQTLVRADHVPIDKFDRYIYAAGVNWSWAALIVPWHALLAVVFPLALVHGLFPSCAQVSWLGKRVFLGLTVTLGAAILFLSLAREPHPQMFFCLLAIFVFVFLGYLLRTRQTVDTRQNASRAFPFLFGLMAYPAAIAGSILLAANGVRPALYFAAVSIGLAALALLSRRYHLQAAPSSVRLALGVYCAAAISDVVGGVVSHSIESLLTGAALAAVSLFLRFVSPRAADCAESPDAKPYTAIR